MDQSDGSLVAASRSGDNGAYSQLVRRHLRRIFAICLSLLGETADAEDAVQETFVRGHGNIDRLRDGSLFGGWIAQIARNYCRDVLRSRQRRPTHPLPDSLRETAEATSDEHDDLRTALARMPEEHRLPLLLYYYDGKDTRTLAQELGLSRGGACARLYRARLLLRKLLEEEATIHER